MRKRSFQLSLVFAAVLSTCPAAAQDALPLSFTAKSISGVLRWPFGGSFLGPGTVNTRTYCNTVWTFDQSHYPPTTNPPAGGIVVYPDGTAEAVIRGTGMAIITAVLPSGVPPGGDPAYYCGRYGDQREFFVSFTRDVTPIPTYPPLQAALTVSGNDLSYDRLVMSPPVRNYCGDIVSPDGNSCTTIDATTTHAKGSWQLTDQKAELQVKQHRLWAIIHDSVLSQSEAAEVIGLVQLAQSGDQNAQQQLFTLAADRGYAIVDEEYVYAISTTPPITVIPTSLPNPDSGQPYTQQICVEGGTAPYLWSVSTDAPGLGFQNVNEQSACVTLAGTPPTTSAGTYSVTVDVEDANQALAHQIYALNLLTSEDTSSIHISPESLTDGTVSMPYGPIDICATGGVPPYVWTGTVTLNGLKIIANTDSTCMTLDGIPLESSTNTPVTVHVEDRAGSAADKTYSLLIEPFAPPSPPPPLEIVSPSFKELPDVLIGQPYDTSPDGPVMICATGGTPPYTWTGPTDFGLFVVTDATRLDCGVVVGTPTRPSKILTKGDIPALSPEMYVPDVIGATVADSTGVSVTTAFLITILNDHITKFLSAEEKQTYLLGASAAAVGTGVVLVACAQPEFAPLCATYADKVAALLIGLTGSQLQGALDPPDADYTTQVTPVIQPLPRVTTSETVSVEQADRFNGVAANAEQQIARMRAFVATINKAQGAVRAHDNCWTRTQLLTAQSYAAEIADLMDAAAALRLSLHEAWADSPSINVSLAELEALQLSTIASAGIPETIREHWISLGIADRDILMLERIIGTYLVDLRLGAGTYKWDFARDPFSPADAASSAGWRSFATRPVVDVYACEPQVTFNFVGFFPPVDNLPTSNKVKAGSSIPVKFSLGGDRGLDVLASTPYSIAVACSSIAAVDVIEESVTAGSSSLAYDPLTDTYTYVWKTDRTWSNTCRQLSLMLIDGAVHQALFQFTK